MASLIFSFIIFLFFFLFYSAWLLVFVCAWHGGRVGVQYGFADRFMPSTHHHQVLVPICAESWLYAWISITVGSVHAAANKHINFASLFNCDYHHSQKEKKNALLAHLLLCMLPFCHFTSYQIFFLTFIVSNEHTHPLKRLVTFSLTIRHCFKGTKRRKEHIKMSECQCYAIAYDGIE